MLAEMLFALFNNKKTGDYNKIHASIIRAETSNDPLARNGRVIEPFLESLLMTNPTFLEIAKHPLGLVGIVLFFVFTALSQKKQKMPTWWPMASMRLAAIALLGGLYLASTMGKRVAPVVDPEETKIKTGDNSPVLQGVNVDGSVIIGNQNNIEKTTQEPKK